MQTSLAISNNLFDFSIANLRLHHLSDKAMWHHQHHFKEVEGEFSYAKSVDGTTTEEIQEALDESIKGKKILYEYVIWLASYYNF